MAGQRLPGPLLLNIRKTLCAIYIDDNAFEDLLLSIDHRLDDYAPSSEVYPKRVEKTIEVAHGSGWLLNLIAKAREKVDDPALKQIEIQLKAIVVVTATNVNQFQTCCLSGGHVMVDRAPLRTALEKLYDPLGRRILVVNDAVPAVGAKPRVQTGKTHSLRLIAHLHQARKDFGLIEVDLQSIRDALTPPKLVWPIDVASSIVALMNMQPGVLPEPPADGQWSRWNLAFCNNFVGQVTQDRIWWIVVDSFNGVLLPQETQDLFKELATRINGVLGGSMRMILLGYSGTFPPSVLPTVKEDALRVFGETELIEFFARAFKEKNRAFTEDDVADSVMRVLSGADPAQPDFLAKAAPLVLAELP